MESEEQGTMRRIDRIFVPWHVFYTVLMVVWSLPFLLRDADCLGREPGYWVLSFSAFPSLVMLVIGCLKPVVAYWAAMVYGAIIALGVIVLLVTMHTYWWVVVFCPLFFYIGEAVVIFVRRSALLGRGDEPAGDSEN